MVNTEYVHDAGRGRAPRSGEGAPVRRDHSAADPPIYTSQNRSIRIKYHGIDHAQAPFWTDTENSERPRARRCHVAPGALFRATSPLTTPRSTNSKRRVQRRARDSNMSGSAFGRRLSLGQAFTAERGAMIPTIGRQTIDTIHSLKQKPTLSPLYKTHIWTAILINKPPAPHTEARVITREHRLERRA